MLQELWGIFPLLRQNIIFSKNYFFPSAVIEWKNLDPILETVRVFPSLRKKYLISYDLLQVLFLTVTILKELNLLQDFDSA